MTAVMGKGMELAKSYYETFGAPMLQEQFPSLLPLIAVGLTGSGSECFGYDDEVSSDHDYEPGFCIFLPGEDVVDRRTAFALERAYAKLPKEYGGFTRSLMQPAGGPRRGVLRMADFFASRVGSGDGALTPAQWLGVPDTMFAEAVNGEIFYDGSGEMTRIRSVLSDCPEDIRRKKLAGALLLMAQSGPYNYERCVRHGETGAAQMAVFEFVRHTMEAVFLLNRTWRPFYKWSFRAMRSLPSLSLLAELLEYLLVTDNDEELAASKQEVIEGIAADISDELARQELTKAVCGDLEKHAWSVNDGIADASVRNMNILAGVSSL